jgi:hypothetical protein
MTWQGMTLIVGVSILAMAGMAAAGAALLVVRSASESMRHALRVRDGRVEPLGDR